ncbi:hypothetical protein NMG60_11006745 [Bertholletia excelsa]
MAGLSNMMNPVSSAQQLLKAADRSGMLLTTSDDTLVKQIIATHAPDREINIKPVLRIAEDILTRATMNMPEGIAPVLGIQDRLERTEELTQQAEVVAMLEKLSYIIDRISCEIAYNCLSGVDGHQTTLSLCKMLSGFTWDAKLVLTLAAFAMTYGEFWLLAQIYSTNSLAKSMAILRQLPVILENAGILKSRFDALNNLINVMLEMTKCIVAFDDLPTTYVTQEVPALSAAITTFPTAVYWTMRGIVACAAQITNLTTLASHEYGVLSTTEAWELSTLAQRIKNVLDHLKKQLDFCYQLIDEKRNVEAYEALLRIFETIHLDNMRVLKALIYPKDDILPLYDGASKKRVNLEILRRKNVLLLISSLDISQDELAILEQTYNESRQVARVDHLYELVWIPMVDRSIEWTEQMQTQFENLRSTMPWYSVYHPSLIDKAVVRFVKERWHFRKKPILVVLDPQGKVVSPNAIHMMWIWGSNAFPFTSLREENLWKEETWRLELLVNGIDPTVLNWIREGKYIFLYGGDDINWIREFTTNARTVAQAARIPLEMVYVGKSGKREQVRRVMATITADNLSHTWQELMIWFFWTRLESMLFSKIQLGRADDRDLMMQEIKKLLSFDKTGGWAVLSRGSKVVVNGHSSGMLPTVQQYDLWKEHVPSKGFDQSFYDHYIKLQGDDRPCCRFEFLSTAGKIPESMKCPECNRFMSKYITFLCCHDDNAISGLY